MIPLTILTFFKEIFNSCKDISDENYLILEKTIIPEVSEEDSIDEQSHGGIKL